MTAGPEDGTAGARRQLRTSRADREQAVDVLKAAFLQGRLSKDEFDLRVGQVFASRTYGDLGALTADLPDSVTSAQPSPERAREPGRALSFKTAVRVGGLAAGRAADGAVLGGAPLAAGNRAGTAIRSGRSAAPALGADPAAAVGRARFRSCLP